MMKQSFSEIMWMILGMGCINKNIDFYKNCIKAFEYCDVNVVLYIGKYTDIKNLGYIPNNF